MEEDKKKEKPEPRKHKVVTRAPQAGNRKHARRQGLIGKKDPTSVSIASGHLTGTKQFPKGTKVVDPYARLPRSQREAARQADLAKSQPKPKKAKKETANE